MGSGRPGRRRVQGATVERWPRAVKAQVALATCAITAGSFSTFGFPSLAPEIRDEFGLTPAAVGAVGAMSYVGALLATIPAGRITDRIGGLRMLVVALSLIAAAVGVAAGAPSAVLFFVGVGLAGIGYGAANPACNVLAARSVPRRRQAVVMSIKQVGVTVGGVLAGLTLPGLALLTSWRIALLVPLVACAAIGLIAIPSAQADSPKLSTPRHNATSNAVTISMSRMALYGFVMAGVQITIVSYVSVYLVDHVHLSSTAAGIGLALTMLGGATGRLGWGMVSDRLFDSRLPPLQLAAAGGALGLLALPLAGPLLVYPLLAWVGLCAIGWNGVYLTMIAESAPEQVGRATGGALVWLYGGAVACPPLFGLIVGAGGSWAMVWIAMGLVVVVAAAASTLQARREQAVSIATEVRR
jgi:MFS family permease